jgi:hypothetical protein
MVVLVSLALGIPTDVPPLVGTTNYQKDVMHNWEHQGRLLPQTRKRIMTARRPPFSSLPLNTDDPPFSAWGLYGVDDELGSLNLLTPENTLEAVKEIKTGESVGLNLPLHIPNPPSHNRFGFVHEIIHKAPRNVHDDKITMNTQVRLIAVHDHK